MLPWRSLLLPFYPTSLMFVAFCAAVSALTSLGGPESSVLKIIAGILVLSYLVKYSYYLLEDAANGWTRPPVATADMLGPFEIRPFFQLMLFVAVGSAAHLAGGSSGAVLWVLYAFFLPASIGLLAVTRKFLDAINPVALLRTVRALGWQYLVIFGYLACLAVGLQFLYQTSIWRIVWYAVADFALLSVFSLVGGLIYVHRDRLGFEPSQSPERKAALLEKDRLRRRGQLFDDLYTSVRMGEYHRAVQELEQWLSAQGIDEMARDVRAVMIQAAQWNSNRGLAALTQCVVTLTLRFGREDVAFAALAATLEHLPTYGVDSEEQAVLLAQHAKLSGRPQLALRIVENFVTRAPSSKVSGQTRSLLQELRANATLS